MDRITLGRMQNPIRGLLHGVAAIAALGGLMLLVDRSWGSAKAMTGSLLYGMALVAMYTVSSLYHSVPWRPEWKVRLQRVDHSMIYLMVAGTFTPIAIAALEGWRLALALVLVWVPGVTGIILKAALPRVATWLSVTLQLSMGWAALVWAPQIHASLGMGAVVFIVLGGACYTIGAIMFLAKKPLLLPGSFSYHELFHVLVVTASVLHFIAVFAYAVPVTVAS